jgi:hypothetical protein
MKAVTHRPVRARRRRSRFPPVAVLGCLLLAGHARAADAPDVFPANPGRWWYYSTFVKVLDEQRRQRMFVANVGFDGRTLLQRRQGGWDHLYAIEEDGVSHQAYVNRRAGGRDAREAFATLLPLPPVVGASWQYRSRLRLIEARTFAADDRLGNRHLPVDLSASVAATDATVEVPAGRFHDCVQVEATGLTLVPADRGNLEVEVRVTQTEWYAPGVGLVKTMRAETADSPFLRSGEYVQELLETGS